MNDSAEYGCYTAKLYKKFGSRNLVSRTGMWLYNENNFTIIESWVWLQNKICILFNNQTRLFIILNLVSLWYVHHFFILNNKMLQQTFYLCCMDKKIWLWKDKGPWFIQRLRIWYVFLTERKNDLENCLLTSHWFWEQPLRMCSFITLVLKTALGYVFLYLVI